MPEWWNSLDSVNRFNTWTSGIGVGLAVLTAVFGVLAFYSNIRVSALRDARESEEKEKAQASQAELQQRTTPRSITAEQRTKFLEIVKLAPKGKLLVNELSSDLEAVNFANQLIGLFKEAGWTVEVRSVLMTEIPVVGLELNLHSLGHIDHTSPVFHAAILGKTLEEIGLKLSATEDKRLGDSEAVFWVGHKPLP